MKLKKIAEGAILCRGNSTIIKMPRYKLEDDLVNNPPHYNMGEIETLDYIEDVLTHNKALTALDGYLLGNILKYGGTRLGNKGSKLQDLKKMQFYLNRMVDRLEKEELEDE